MSRKQKPMKIKRHKKTMSSNGASETIKRFLPIALGVVLVVGIGFLLGKPVLAFLENINDKSSSTQDSQLEYSSDSQSSEQDSSEVIIDSSSNNQETDVIPEKTENRKYFYTTPRSLSSPEKIDAVIAQMNEKGATHCVFDVKNPDGNIMYDSNNEYAKQLVGDVKIDVKLVDEKMKQNNLVPVARIYTFMDKLISNIERTTAVMYLGTDTRWLDSSVALGGKPWANPANKIVQDYITDITEEIMSLGVTEVIFAGFSTPTGYSLDKRDFGATTDQVLANMKNLLNTLEAKISAKGGHAIWQFEYSAVKPDGDYSQYIVHPYQLGADNMIITAKGSEVDVQAAIAQLTSDSSSQEIDMTLWLTDNVNSDLTHTMNNYFVN